MSVSFIPLSKNALVSGTRSENGDRRQNNYRKVCEYLQRSGEYTWHSQINTYNRPPECTPIFTGRHREKYLHHTAVIKAPEGLQQGSGVQLELPWKSQSSDWLWIHGRRWRRRRRRRRKSIVLRIGTNMNSSRSLLIDWFIFISLQCLFVLRKNLLFSLTCCFQDVLYGRGTFVNDWLFYAIQWGGITPLSLNTQSMRATEEEEKSKHNTRLLI